MTLEIESTIETKQKYKFSRDYFSWNCSQWPTLLKPYAGKPNINYLEIGINEGHSLFWMLDNILTHESSKVTAIDTFEKDFIYKAFKENLERNLFKDKITIYKSRSDEVLRTLKLDSFDIIYIDGSHLARDVFVDIALSWGLLKNDGVLILDDAEHKPEWPPELSPTLPITTFLTSFSGGYNLLFKGNQVIVRKINHPCDNQYDAITFGPYIFNYSDKKLRKIESEKLIPLTPHEINLLQGIMWGRNIGEIRFRPPTDFKNNPIWNSLANKLELRIVNGVIEFSHGGI